MRLILKFMSTCIMSCVIVLFFYLNALAGTPRYYHDVFEPSANEVYIGPVSIEMPEGRFVLIKIGKEYCALKFIKIWSENYSSVGTPFISPGSDDYAIYEMYYQSDGTGDFRNDNTKYTKEDLKSTRPRGIGMLRFTFGNQDIFCGKQSLVWHGKGAFSFYERYKEEGDYGVELAPTKWTDISEVNAHTPQIKWYRLDSKRKGFKMNINGVWDDTTNEPTKEGVKQE